MPGEGSHPQDRAAYSRLFDEHAEAVHAHALRSTGDSALADEVVSLTFLEAWRLRDRLRTEAVRPRARLLGIATDVLRNTARSARRHRAALFRLPPREPVPDFADEVVGRIAAGTAWPSPGCSTASAANGSSTGRACSCSASGRCWSGTARGGGPATR
ncbi:RNA polymerase sigma factor [Streptomyces sp. NRRL B-24484]|uniref:RNA polymerase sigma factor n=1 Tax=Streptomyces sp. NRRL B-24484 TaxID=1463833 RepID=UPI000694DA02|nr:sigma factor [Streptomyces sp. NRRL B-24484]